MTASVHTAERDGARAHRLELRRFLQDESRLPRVRRCGARRIDSKRGVVIRCSYEQLDRATAHVSNIQRCGSLWSCAWCAPKVRQTRAEEIRIALRTHLRAGGGAYFITVTIPHSVHFLLAAQLDAVIDGWRYVWSGPKAMAAKDALGHVGAIKAVEATHSDVNGWHSHLHIALLTDEELHPFAVAALEQFIYDRFAHRVTTKHGAQKPARYVLENNRLQKVGVHLEPIRSGADVSKYLTKLGGGDPALELARGDLKHARAKSSRSPWQILQSAYDNTHRRWGNRDQAARDLKLWHVWELATLGRNVLTWSPGLKRRFGLLDVTDEEIAERAEDGQDVVELPIATWLVVRRRWRGVSDVLEAAERGGFAAVDLLLGTWGLHSLAPPRHAVA